MCYKPEAAGVSTVMASNVEAQLSTCRMRKESLEGGVYEQRAAHYLVAGD